MALTFGQPQQPASGGFSFAAPSTPSPFGAPAATPSFGAASTPSLFGATPSPAPAFGAASTPAFGAPSSAPAFGTSSPAFGTSTSAPAFGGFGSTLGAASGQQPQPFGVASSSSLFGSTQTGALFGGQQPQQPAGGSIFGGQQQQQQQQQQMAPLAYSTGAAPPDMAQREVANIVAAYTPTHPSYRFSHLFLNVVDPSQRVRPQHVDEQRWKQALREAGGPDNPDRLWPVQANGFGDLSRRARAQQDALEENRSRLDALRDLSYKLAKRQQGELRARTAAMQARHVELSGRLLKVARHVDGLEGRLAMFMGVRGDQSRAREAAIGKALDRIEAELSSASAGGIQRRLDALAAAARLRGGGLGGAASGAAVAASREAVGAKLDAVSIEQLFGVLQEHAAGLRQLQDLIRRDILDVEIIKGASAASMQANGGPGLNMAMIEAA